MPKKKKLKFKFKIKWKNWLKLLLFIFIVFLIIKVIMFFTNTVSDQKEIELINKKTDQTKITNIVDDKTTIVTSPTEDTSKFDDYYEFHLNLHSILVFLYNLKELIIKLKVGF